MDSTFDASALIENHIAFTRLHRGEVRPLPGALEICSALPGFSAAVLSAPSADPGLVERHAQVRLVPGGEVWRPALERAGFSETGALRYMILAGDFRAWRSSSAVRVRTAGDLRDIATFTDIQARGFAEPGEEPAGIAAMLGPWNERNLGHPDQRFLVAELDGTPAGTTLVVRSGGGKLVGIYAVATVPELRNRGVSTTLLRDAVEAEVGRGAELVTLQVHEGTPAQRLYESLGFQTAFRSPIYTRPEAPPNSTARTTA